MRSTSTIADDLLESVQTKADKLLLMSEIEVLMPTLYKVNGQTFEKTLRESIRPEISRIILDTLQRYAIPLNDQQGRIKYFLETVKTALLETHSITITIAFKPDPASIGMIAEWAKKSLTFPVVIDVVYDPTIMGGAIISYGGSYKNLSVLKDLEAYFAPEITHKPA
jgi:hypothetical protein